MVKLPVVSPLKKIECFPTVLSPEALTCRELHFRILITILKGSLLKGSGVGLVTETSHVPLHQL